MSPPLNAEDVELLIRARYEGLFTDALNGKGVCITGVLSMQRRDVEALIKAAGGHVDAAINMRTKYLVHGELPGGRETTKIRSARDRGITILTEENLVELLSVVPL